MTREMSFKIREKDAGRTLAAFMVARFTYHTGAEWGRLICEGRVRVNGYATLPEVVLRTDDVVRYDASDIPEPPVDETFRIVSDDPLLLVVDKSGNLPCHPGGRYFNHTLWALLKARCGLSDPILVNRIDRETSGLVMVGKTPEAAQNLWKQFVAHKVAKRYTVFVEGEFPEQLDVSGWLSADPASAIRKKRRFTQAEAVSLAPDKASEWAETSFERVRVCKGFSVVTVRPRTGRLHQIRATLLSLGFPVVGDKLYGLDERFFLKFCDDSLTPEDRALLRMPRQALHADTLAFIHPRFGTPTELTAPLPADMAALLD